MSIFLEFIPNLLAALAFDFIVYLTGAGVLRVISFGVFKYQLHSYSEFKKLKAKPNNGFFMPYVMGVLFYAAIIVFIAWFN